MASDFPHSFLVTSVGAYDDSGIGTGGFVCVREGEAIVIDKIDSTGLCAHGTMFFRFARGLQTIIGYDEGGVRLSLRLPEARDVHDIIVRDQQFVCVSTGTNEILRVTPLGAIVNRRQFEGERDAWHLNCLWPDNGKLFLSAFGRFAAHRGWVGNCTGTGFVLDLETDQEVCSGLNGPHTPRLIDGEWVICDSHARALRIQRANGTVRVVQLAGFTRGLTFDANHYYVGESANRKADILSDHSHIAVIDRRSLEVSARIRVPFPEIYDIVMVPPSFAERVAQNLAAFQIDQRDQRSRALETQIELGHREIEKLKLRLADLASYASFKQTLTVLKRRLLGQPIDQ
jgi:hypothetical protein